jgi:uncharacterized membrane protein
MFEDMSFGQAVSYVQTVGVIMNLMLLSIPVAAVVAIRRGKRNRPGARLLFPRCVLWGWVLLLISAIAYFFTGAWYGENGPPPQTIAAQVTVTLVAFVAITVAIHVGLYRTTQGKQRGPVHGA